ncbi:unnamed protein product [Hymenolepis diminuta]|uniref:PWI domain-containing protein n=1 Tax=Hymenolepis diminuta TaxID=6216 RepID=A0A0R3SGD5_HYMDI|nr:unnamed protein product [Hymenolepis diminuta]
MTDAGFFKGTNTEQDSRFADKKKKLLKSMKFGENLSEKVDTSRINVDSIKPWIVKRITELLSFDDDIVCDFVVNMLSPDPKEIQINLSAFLGSKNARIFVGELWDLLLSAMNTPGGVPAILLEAKKAEILSSKVKLNVIGVTFWNLFPLTCFKAENCIVTVSMLKINTEKEFLKGLEKQKISVS